MKKVYGISLFVLLVAGLVIANVALAGQDDSLLSQHVKEADGTSGQNTNSGAGIKTGHIQDGAVTSSKIADGAVTSTKIATSAVLPDKLGFYSNVLIVSQTGGDFTNPADALDAITDASASNPYLVKLMPGVYNVGNLSVQMKPYVDLEGAGIGITKIAGAVDYGLVKGAANSEIRDLSLENNAPSYSIAISNGAPSFKVTNVAASATGPNAIVVEGWRGGSIALKNFSAFTPAGIGIWAESNSLDLDNVSIAAASFGIELTNGWQQTLSMSNVTINVTGNGLVYGIYGGWLGGSSITARNLSVSATSNDLAAIGINSSTTITNLKDSDITVSGPQWSTTGFRGCNNTVLENVTVSSNQIGVSTTNGCGDFIIERSTIKGAYSVYVDGSAPPTTEKIAVTQLSGPIWVYGSVSDFRCFQVYDAEFNPFVCP